MSSENRVEYLLRAAARAEREGNERLASVLRKMAWELSPGAFALHPSGIPGSGS